MHVGLYMHAIEYCKWLKLKMHVGNAGGSYMSQLDLYALEYRKCLKILTHMALICHRIQQVVTTCFKYSKWLKPLIDVGLMCPVLDLYAMEYSKW